MAFSVILVWGKATDRRVLFRMIGVILVERLV